jgi:hypothetical protein
MCGWSRKSAAGRKEKRFAQRRKDAKKSDLLGVFAPLREPFLYFERAGLRR